MRIVKKYGLLESNRVFFIKIASIRPNPAQPRRIFESESLLELSESIREFGVLQPLSVRKINGAYELIAGERRLRASRLAGLDEVPCILLGADEKKSSMLALVENLQRQDLDVFEEAEGIATLIRGYGLSQDEAARRLSLSQSAVANKLRLLRHSKNVVETIRNNGLTERHARALLRLDNDADKSKVLESIIQNQMNVAQTDAYITQYLEHFSEESVVQDDDRVALLPPGKNKKRGAKTFYLFKDVRLFMNSITKAVDLMRRAGVDTVYDKSENGDEVVVTIKISKAGHSAKNKLAQVL